MNHRDTEAQGIDYIEIIEHENGYNGSWFKQLFLKYFFLKAFILCAFVSLW